VDEKIIIEGLARLDADIAEAERVLADLKLKRKGALSFLDYLGVSVPREPVREHQDGLIAVVKAAIAQRDVIEFTTKQIIKIVEDAGHREFSRVQISNGITYLRRKNLVEKAEGPRGSWRWIGSTEGFAAPSENTEASSSKPELTDLAPRLTDSNDLAEARPFAVAPPPLPPEAATG
jgi:hypothetical protein